LKVHAIAPGTRRAKAVAIMIPCCFAIIPDRSHQPLALFSDLQDAMDWGLSRLGGNSFRIKYISIARIESEDAPPKPVQTTPLLMRS
jgi:hypothetical protein